MANVKITKPFRFFGFFGLFLVFLFLAVKTCSERKPGPDFVNAGDITTSKKEGVSSKEHTKFIKKVKKDIRKQEKSHKNLSAKDIVKLEDHNTDKKTVKKIKAKAKGRVEKSFSKKPSVKKSTKRSKTFKSETVLVKGRAGKVDSYSKAQLKKNVRNLNKLGRGKVMVYGSYFPGEAKGKGFVRAAKIKNELISAGLKPSISVFVLPEKKTSKAFLGRVKFSK